MKFRVHASKYVDCNSPCNPPNEYNQSASKNYSNSPCYSLTWSAIKKYVLGSKYRSSSSNCNRAQLIQGSSTAAQNYRWHSSNKITIAEGTGYIWLTLLLPRDLTTSFHSLRSEHPQLALLDSPSTYYLHSQEIQKLKHTSHMDISHLSRSLISLEIPLQAILNWTADKPNNQYLYTKTTQMGHEYKISTTSFDWIFWINLPLRSISNMKKVTVELRNMSNSSSRIKPSINN